MRGPTRGAVLGLSLFCTLACSGLDPAMFETCELPPPPDVPPGTQAVAPVNDGAIAGYDSLDAAFDFVDGEFPAVTACEGVHTQPLTHAPGNAIDDPKGDPYRHIDTLTFIGHAESVGAGDLFLHGDGPGYLAIRNLDLRKFLYQNVVLRDCATETCDTETLPGDDGAWKGAEPAYEGYAGEPFDSDRFACVQDVHGFFAEFNRIAKRVPELNGDGDLRLHVTNNCREPGNYEFAVVSESEGKLYKDHASLDIAFYSKILEEIDVALEDLGTGIRVVGTERKEDGSYVYEDVVPKEFPAECHMVNLAPYIGKGQKLLTKQPVPIEVASGPIPYDQFSDETNQKSGLTNESIVYVEVSDTEAPTDFSPQGFWFQMAEDGVIERYNEDADWDALVAADTEGGAVHAPHTFATFEDVLAYPFAISAFEVDGRYLGRMPEERLLDDTLRLYGFDYSYLKDLKTAEVRMAVNPTGRPDASPPRLEFRLLSDNCTDERCVNIVIGNIQLDPGQSTSMVLGIGTQPLSHDYEDSTYQAVQQYALTYDQDGMLTEHVSDYGLGLAVVRRDPEQKTQYIVDFVAYERAVPLWRGTVDTKRKAATPGVTGKPTPRAPAAAARRPR